MDSSHENSFTPANRRDAYRCRVPGGRSASLSLGKRQFGITVLDESAHGFAVSLISEQPIEWQVGQSLLLSISDEILDVRLANVSSETIAPSEANKLPIIYMRLGLTRLVEGSARRFPVAVEILKRLSTMPAIVTPARGICVAIVCCLLIALARGLLNDFQQRVSYWYSQLP
jgi:hypothetical protein